jgi:DNA-binding XRE family transcriptional regulator
VERITGQPNAMRERRRESELTQAELATRAGVSRQLIAAVEAGQHAPSVDAALRLAGALGMTVEALFSPPPPSFSPAVGERLRDGSLVRVGRVGERLVATKLADHGAAGAGWAKPDGIIEERTLRLFEGASPAGLVLAGCDPAIGIAESMLQGLGARSLLAIPAATGTALRSLVDGGVHAAVVHGPDGQLPAPPCPALRLHLARWQVGIAHSRSLGRQSLGSLLDGGVRIAQRDPAASSQQAFRRALASAGIKAPRRGPEATGHIDAARIAAMLDCAAVTTESAARAFGLRFVALEQHTVEVWVAEPWRSHPALEALADLLCSAAFTDRVGRFGGYELAGCGSRV